MPDGWTIRSSGESCQTCNIGLDDLVEHENVDGFCQVVVHPGFDGFVPCLIEGVGREADDAGGTGVFRALKVSDPTRDLESIEAGHLDIHEHEIERVPAKFRESVRSVGCDGCVTGSLLQEDFQQLAVRFVVFSNQDIEFPAWLLGV